MALLSILPHVVRCVSPVLREHGGPMPVVIDEFRRVVLHGQAPELTSLLISTGLIAVLGFFAYSYFKKWVEVKFADLI